MRPLSALYNNFGAALTTTPTITSAALWVDYIYLDTDERRRFAQVSHEYLIEQLQYTGDEALTTSHKLNFNHPVKELVWVGRLNASIVAKTTGDTAGGNQWFNFTSVKDNSNTCVTTNINTTGNLTVSGILTGASIAGTVVGTTQSPSNNSTKLATTAYVDAQVATEDTIAEMNDTTMSGLANLDLLMYNSGTSVWENKTLTAAGVPTKGFTVAMAVALG